MQGPDGGEPGSEEVVPRSGAAEQLPALPAGPIVAGAADEAEPEAEISSEGAATAAAAEEAEPGAEVAEGGAAIAAAAEDGELEAEVAAEGRDTAAVVAESPERQQPEDTVAAGGVESLSPAGDSTDPEPEAVATPLPRTRSAGYPPHGKPRKRDAFFAATQVSSVVHSEAWRRLNAELAEVPAIQVVAETLQVTPMAVVLAGLLGALCFLLFGLGGQLVCTAFGVVYPAFESFKAVEEFANLQDPSDVYAKASGMQFWLTYWVVAAAVVSFEHIFYYVLVWLPFYYPMKLVALLWFYLPASRGANHVYHLVVSPVLRRNRSTIDTALEESSRKLKESGRKLRREVTGSVTSGLGKALGAGAGGAKQLRRTLSAMGPFVGEAARAYLYRRGGKAATGLPTKVEAEAEE